MKPSIKHLLFTGVFGLFSLLSMTACGGDDDEIPDPEPEPVGPVLPASAQRTVLVYIAAENSLSSFTQSDINEMLEGIQMVNYTVSNLLVYLDDASTSRTPQLLHITVDSEGNAQKEVVKTYSEQDSVDPTVMATVMNDAYGAYPTSSYGLVLWSHGEGWISELYDLTSSKASRISTQWWGIDSGNNSSSNSGDNSDKMSMNELAEALRATVHLDFILFDSCFMNAIEVAYELKDYANYFIGSPMEIPGPGAPYDTVVPAMFGTGSSYITDIAEVYYTSYADNYDTSFSGLSNNYWTGGVCLSIIQSSALPALASATAAVLPTVVTEDNAPIYNDVMCYDETRSNKYYHDMKDFMRQELADNPTAFATWEQAFAKAVVYFQTTPTAYSAFSAYNNHTITMKDGIGGMAMFIPRLVKSDMLPYFHQMKWYSASGWDQTGW